jgi:hypothetical protein
MVPLLQRTARHPFAESGDQLYETPACATRALLRVEALPFRIWEPAAGRGAIARVLREHGHQVVAEDLRAYDGAERVRPGRDFFAATAAPADCHMIVTNPPFRHADRFIRHGLALVPKVIVLLRLAALEGTGRSDLIDGSLVRLWIGIERLPMMHRDGWDGPRLNGSAAPYAWFHFATDHPGGGFVGRRMSWRDD